MSSADHDLSQRVERHPFLAGLNAPHIAILADCAGSRRWSADEILFCAGDPATGFYLIESGSVAVEGAAADKPAVAIDTVSAGEPLGWSWIFEPFVCEYGARALEPTTAIFIDALQLAQHRGGDLTLGHELFKRMSKVMVRRLNSARAKVLQAAREEARLH